MPAHPARLLREVELGEQATEVLEHRADEGLVAKRASACPSSSARVPAIVARRNSSFSRLACASSVLHVLEQHLPSARLRMPAKPIMPPHRETVLMLPLPALE